MPVCFDPAATRRFCLKADRERPESQRVYFKARYLTCQEVGRVLDILNGNDGKGDGLTILRQAYEVGLIGPVDAKDPRTGEVLPCTLDSIGRILSPSEMWDLAYEYPFALDDDDLKKSDSPSASNSAESALDAGQANA